MNPHVPKFVYVRLGSWCMGESKTTFLTCCRWRMVYIIGIDVEATVTGPGVLDCDYTVKHRTPDQPTPDHKTFGPTNSRNFAKIYMQ
jgi:hypothetical protein